MEDLTPKRLNRTEWIDSARGICLILMIICHSCNGHHWNQFNGVTGYFFLLFFFLSAGLCFNHNRTLKTYFFKQTKKILVVYLLFSIAYEFTILFYKIPNGISSDDILGAIVSIVYAIPINVDYLGIQTTGTGPMWFLLCFWVSTVMYKSLDSIKAKPFIIITLAIAANISQRFIVLPLTIQDACIACLFIWIGDRFKHQWNWLEERVAKINGVLLLVFATILSGVLLCVIVIVFFVFSTCYVDLGTNHYSIFSIFISLMGFVLVIIVCSLFKKVNPIHKFLQFYGKESMTILLIHSIDISIIRRWAFLSAFNAFITIITYALLVYFWRIMKCTVNQRMKNNYGDKHLKHNYK